MKLPVPRAADKPKADEQRYLKSWKEVAAYMRCGVRTVQRYERECGLPVRRPTGKSRGAVMATRAEIDAWVAAAPIRGTFRFARIQPDSRTRNQTNKLEAGVNALRKLKEQTLALRTETRTVMNLLLDRLSAAHSLLPAARREGYQPLINMDVDMDMDRRLHLKLGENSGASNAAERGRRGNSVREDHKV